MSSPIAIHDASIDEASLIGVQIAECPPMTLAEIRDRCRRRLDNRDNVILMGSFENVRCGCAIGYEAGGRAYCLWLCAVLEAFRGRGVAAAMLAALEERVRGRGYASIRACSGNQYPAMLRLLIRTGYRIADLEKGSSPASHVVTLVKSF